MSSLDLTLEEVAKKLRKQGHDAGALLIEMGAMQLFFDFRKRARAENIDSADQIDAIAKMFASIIIPYASGIENRMKRLAVITSILGVVEGHMTNTASVMLSSEI